MTVFISTQPIHNWHWFPVIGMLTIPFSHIDDLNLKTRITLITLVLSTIAFNFYASLNFIKKEIYYKELNNFNMLDISYINECLNETAKK